MGSWKVVWVCVLFVSLTWTSGGVAQEPEDEGPGDLFVGRGPGIAVGGDQCEVQLVLTVVRTDEGWFANFMDERGCYMVYYMQAWSGGYVIPLQGDWEQGFVGSTPYNLTWIEIGPYDQGTDIPVFVCFWCFGGATAKEGVVFASINEEELPVSG